MKIPKYLSDHVQNNFRAVSEHVLKNTLFDKKVDSDKNIMIVSGFSGSGKDTLIEQILNISGNFGKVKTVTTRAIRPEESVTDDPYIRVSRESMAQLLSSDDVVESVAYAGEYYCTTKSEIQKVVEAGKMPILRIDPKGASYYNSSNNPFLTQFIFTSFFVVTESIEELKQRLLARGSNEELIEKRMAQLQLDLSYVSESHYLVVNTSGDSKLVASEMVDLIRMS